MRQLAADEIEHAVLAETDTGGSPRSRVTIGGAAGEIEGAVIEAVVAAGARYLFFLTHDVPYEEALTITLTDARLAAIDQARLGGMYATGHFSDLETDPPAKIRFRFFDGKVWTVTLLDRPAVRIPLLSEPAGVHRGLSFQRLFTITAQPDR